MAHQKQGLEFISNSYEMAKMAKKTKQNIKNYQHKMYKYPGTCQSD